MKTVYISLGSNVGDSRANIDGALQALAATGVEIKKRSWLYETAPRDFLDQPWFLNMVAECRTDHSPLELLSQLLLIERKLGRDRSASAISKGPRIIDIDILLFGEEIIDTPQLTVPHPRMLERRFVLEPLIEIAPHLRHPATRELLERSLAAVRDQALKKIS